MEAFSRVGFADIETKVPDGPGLYLICSGEERLKVGIGASLRKRLRQHLASRQRCLHLKPGGSWANPRDIVRKQSILAKHLFFSERRTDYDLKTEQGRREFLLNECYVLFLSTRTRAEAREMEQRLEHEGGFQYAGQVLPKGDSRP